MRAEFYADLARQFGTYSRDHGDNRLYRIAAGAAEDDYHWTEVLMEALGYQLGGSKAPTARGASLPGGVLPLLHRPGPWEHKGSATEFDLREYYRTVHEAQRLRGILAGHAAAMDAYDPERQVGLSWTSGAPGSTSSRDQPRFPVPAEHASGRPGRGVHFDAFHDHAERLVMANIAQTVNVLQAMILTDGEALV
jgi:alpha-N-arabinofuranosidase